jgi:hypothetical protein
MDRRADLRGDAVIEVLHRRLDGGLGDREDVAVVVAQPDREGERHRIRQLRLVAVLRAVAGEHHDAPVQPAARGHYQDSALQHECGARKR